MRQPQQYKPDNMKFVTDRTEDIYELEFVAQRVLQQ